MGLGGQGGDGGDGFHLEPDLAGPPAGPGGPRAAPPGHIFDLDGHGLFGDSRNPARLLEPQVVVDGVCRYIHIK